MRTIIVLCTALLFGCAAKSDTRTFDIAPSITDDWQLEAFMVSYRNTGKKTVCLAPDNWPNSSGKMEQASSRVWFDIGGSRYTIEDFNTGFCPQCAVKVRVGEIVKSKIPYTEFYIPSSLYSSQKSLHFRPTGFFCS